MKNLDNISDLITAYIDGDIDSTSESILFNRLAGESELRNELREHIVIRTIVQEDSALLLPPDRLRQQVMTSAGIVDSEVGQLPWYRDAIRLPLLAALTATIVTLLLIGRSDHPDPTTPTINAPAKSSGRQVSGGALPRADREPEGQHARLSAAPQTYATRSMRHNTPQPLQESAVQSEAPTHSTESVVELPSIHLVAPRGDPSAMIQPPLVAFPSALESRPIALESSFGSVSNPGGLDDIASAEEHFKGELRGGIGGSFPSVAIAPSSRRLPDGVGASLFYRLDGENSLGIGVGVKSVGQEYQGVENGEVVHYRQNPTLVWIGAHYRRTFNSEWFGGHLRPFVGGVAGGTTLGPAGSIEAGLLFTPDERTSFLAGVDGSLFAYRFQGGWFSSRTLGVVYGVSLTF